jgi:hypothetical protein
MSLTTVLHQHLDWHCWWQFICTLIITPHLMGPNYTAVLENHLHVLVEVVLLMIQQATSFMHNGDPLTMALLLASF